MYKHIFGPVPSRRLGMSLGVDMVPKKVCSLNCVYCEVGQTTLLTTQRKEYVPGGEVIEELKDVVEETKNIIAGKFIFYVAEEIVEVTQ